jgi:hypothetical protein
MKRLLLFLIAAAIAWYLAKSYGLFSPSSTAAPSVASPIERARTAAAASDARTSAGAAAGREADQPGGAAGVTENMTPDQVRALLGSPDDVQTETTASGTRMETWTYRSAGKTVVFEKGIATSIR